MDGNEIEKKLNQCYGHSTSKEVDPGMFDYIGTFLWVTILRTKIKLEIGEWNTSNFTFILEFCDKNLWSNAV